MEPTLLALDTSTDAMALALLSRGEVLLRLAPGGAAASSQLLPTLRSMLAEAGLTPAQLDAVAFGQGPGAFTGLRTACAVAQGLAFGIGCPVLPIDSLMLVADDARAALATAPADGVLQWVAMDARMDEVYAAAYRWQEDRWRVAVAPALYTLAALAQCWQAAPPARVAGSAITAFGARLPLATALCRAAEHDRPRALARLARQAWREGLAIDPAQALPLYLRDKVALTSAERLAQRAAAASA